MSISKARWDASFFSHKAFFLTYIDREKEETTSWLGAARILSERPKRFFFTLIITMFRVAAELVKIIAERTKKLPV